MTRIRESRAARAILTMVALLFFWRRKPASGPGETVEREVGASRRLERGVVSLLLASIAGSLTFIVLYVLDPNTQLLGLALGATLAILAIAAVVAGKGLVPQEEVREAYHEFGEPEEQADVEDIVREGGEGITRRRLIATSAGAAGVALGAAAVVPLASLGPSVANRIYATPWEPGKRVVDEENRPILAGDVEVGNFLTGFPAGANKDDLGASILILRFGTDQLELTPEQMAGAPNGIVAYSKICTHAGCAVSMYRDPLYDPTEPGPALVCPCHYSTFDPLRGGAVEFGPAARALPMLPLRIGSGGQLEAAGDFLRPVGPSYSGSREENQ